MNQNSRVRKTLVNTFSGLVSQLVSLFLNFGMRTVFITTLGIQYIGVSSVFSDLLNMLSFTELGIGTAIATALYQPLHDRNLIEVQKIMHFYRNAYRYIAGVICVIGVGLLPFLNKIITNVPDIKEDIHLIFVLYIAKTALSYLLVYRSTLLSADQRRSVVNIIVMYVTIGKTLLEIVALLITHQFMSYLVIEVLTTVIQNIWLSSRATQAYPTVFVKSDERLSKSRIKGLFKDVKGLAMYSFSESIGNSLNSVMVSSLISTSVAGLLATYTLIQRQVESLIRQFFSAVIPSVGNLVADRDTNRQYIVFKRIYYFGFIMVNFCSTSFFVLIKPFILIWIGSKYVMGWDVAFVVAADSFVYILLQAVAAFRTANGLFVKGQYRPLITAILNIILTFAFVKYFGAAGAIGATVVSRLITQWYDPYLLYKLIFHKDFWPFVRTNLWYGTVFMISVLLTSYTASQLEVNNHIVSFALKIVLCLIIPNILTWISTFKTPEYQYFKGYALRLFGKYE